MHRNRILSVLRNSHPDLARDHLKPIIFERGDVLAETGTPVARILFPCSGMVSIVVDLRDGEHIETAMVGREGLLGAGAALGGGVHLNTICAQISGSGWSMAAAELVKIAREDEDICRLVLRQEQFIMAQAQQTAACNARHHIPQRLCTWLLRAHDATGEHEMQLTQEFIAQMLGVQRATISIIAAQLQDKRLIRYHRGHLLIVDRVRLAEEACECHRALRLQYARLFGGAELADPGVISSA